MYMVGINYLSYLKKLVELTNKMSKELKNSSKWSKIILFVAIFTLIGSVYYNSVILSLTEESTRNSEKSARIANDALNETRKLIEWTKPMPNIKVSMFSKNMNSNGTVCLELSPYSIENGVGDYEKIISTKIEVNIENIGKASLPFALLYINLSANFHIDEFPFKIFRITTPLDELAFDLDNKYLTQTYELDYPDGATIKIPYYHPNENLTPDFPPSLIDGEILYNSISQAYTYFGAINESQQIGSYQKGPFGPFRIGTILPGETKFLVFELFAVVDDYWNSRPFANLMYADGYFDIIIESEQEAVKIFKIPLEAYLWFEDQIILPHYLRRTK